MAHVRTGSTRRYKCAHLICSSLLARNTGRAVVTARKIALFHHLPEKAYQSISAVLNFLYSNGIRNPRLGSLILGTCPFRKCDYPHHYTIELIDGGRGLL